MHRDLYTDMYSDMCTDVQIQGCMVPHIDYVLRECVECLKQRLAEQSRPPFLRLAGFREQLRAEIDAWNEKLPPVDESESGNDDDGEGRRGAGTAHELSAPGRLDRMVEDLEVPDHICILPSVCTGHSGAVRPCQASEACLYTCLCTHVYTCLCTCLWARHQG